MLKITQKKFLNTIIVVIINNYNYFQLIKWKKTWNEVYKSTVSEQLFLIDFQKFRKDKSIKKNKFENLTTLFLLEKKSVRVAQHRIKIFEKTKYDEKVKNENVKNKNVKNKKVKNENVQNNQDQNKKSNKKTSK